MEERLFAQAVPEIPPSPTVLGVEEVVYELAACFEARLRQAADLFTVQGLIALAGLP